MAGARETIRRCRIGRLLLTNKITTGGKLQTSLRGEFKSGTRVGLVVPPLALYASGTTVVNTTKDILFRGKRFTKLSLGTGPNLSVAVRGSGWVEGGSPAT